METVEIKSWRQGEWEKPLDYQEFLTELLKAAFDTGLPASHLRIRIVPDYENCYGDDEPGGRISLERIEAPEETAAREAEEEQRVAAAGGVTSKQFKETMSEILDIWDLIPERR